MWVAGVDIDWRLAYDPEPPPRLPLPPYPFLKQRYWVEAVPAAGPPQPTPPETLLLTEVWQPESLPPANVDWTARLERWQGQRLLILCDNDPDYTALRDLLASITALVEAPPAYEIHRLGDVAGPTPPPWLEADHPPGAVLLASRTASPSMAEVKAFFHLVQGWLKHAPSTPLQGYYLFTGAQPLLQALSGLTGSARLENPQHVYKLIQVDDSLTGPQRAVVLLNEWLLAGAEPAAVRYEGLTRQVRRLQPDPTPSAAAPPPFRAGAAYLVAGGLGQLGQALCAHLARTYQATLVLLGRSPAPGPALAQLRQQGGSIHYYPVDITDLDALTATLARIKTVVPELHGVIHLARQVEDSLIVNKTFADFERVSAPKVAGTRHLDVATRAEPLDFFLMFSSMAAYGLKGSPDYAYATAYQNAFARHRQGPGRTLALCWGQWAMDPYSTPERNQNLAQLGFDLLTLDAALPLLAHALNQPQPVVGALAVSDAEQVKSVLGITAPATTSPASQLVADLQAGRLTRAEALQAMADLNLNQIPDADIDSLHTLLLAAPTDQPPPPPDITAIILDSLQKILKLEAGAIAPTEPLQNYGLDSITGTQLAVALEKSLGLEVRPGWLIDHPTVEALARKLTEMRSS